jgi:hypothetical protein
MLVWMLIIVLHMENSTTQVQTMLPTEPDTNTERFCMNAGYSILRRFEAEKPKDIKDIVPGCISIDQNQIEKALGPRV